MSLDADACYQAVLARDPRFDGAFFTAVATTKVSCRTVCAARTPRRENCSFHPSAAAFGERVETPCPGLTAGRPAALLRLEAGGEPPFMRAEASREPHSGPAGCG